MENALLPMLGVLLGEFHDYDVAVQLQEHGGNQDHGDDVLNVETKDDGNQGENIECALNDPGITVLINLGACLGQPAVTGNGKQGVTQHSNTSQQGGCKCTENTCFNTCN